MTLTTIPGGLVDAHAHYTLDLDDAGLPEGDWAARVAHNLAAARAAGVLAARDAGSRDGLDPALLGGAQVVAAGRFLAPAGRYHAHLIRPTPPEELVAESERQARGGVPWVKVIADFPGADGNWFAPVVNYEVALVERAVAAAHAHGARVMAHVSGPVVGELVRIGVDSIEHGPLIDAALVDEMAARGTLWCPTVATIERHIAPLRDVAPPVAACFERWARTLPLAVARGVPVLAGSDELGPAGVAAEAEALVRIGGLTPAQATHAATAVPRRVLGLPADAGEAVTFDGDPTKDIMSLARVRTIAAPPPPS
ncbi:MAG TPA: amidohydrolase family protein [Baekduia sp.]|nr:amidohydrolase family protein [Baekduia sp.]